MSASQNFQQYREMMNELAANKIPALPYLGMIIILYIYLLVLIENI